MRKRGKENKGRRAVLSEGKENEEGDKNKWRRVFLGKGREQRE